MGPEVIDVEELVVEQGRQAGGLAVQLRDLVEAEHERFFAVDVPHRAVEHEQRHREVDLAAPREVLERTRERGPMPRQLVLELLAEPTHRGHERRHHLEQRVDARLELEWGASVDAEDRLAEQRRVPRDHELVEQLALAHAGLVRGGGPERPPIGHHVDGRPLRGGARGGGRGDRRRHAGRHDTARGGHARRNERDAEVEPRTTHPAAQHSPAAARSSCSSSAPSRSRFPSWLYAASFSAHAGTWARKSRTCCGSVISSA